MWTGSPGRRPVIQRSKSAPQPLGRRLTGRLCLLAGFCLLVLAVMPVTAQAVPLNYSNGATLKESNGVFGEAGVKEIIGWGTLDLKCVSGACGTNHINCHYVIGGDVWNPIGGGAGKGETQASATFDCESNLCATGAPVTLAPEELPWLSELQETGLAKTNKFRSHTEHVKLVVACNLPNAHFQGSYQPGAPAGEDKGTRPAHPGFLEFDQPGSGTLSEEELAGQSAITGEVRGFGYAEQELINVK